jgi:hypothetical protein
MEKSEVISLSCPNCGAVLSIPQSLKKLTCNYCKSLLSLIQNESISALQIVSENLQNINAGTTAIALEMKLSRLKEDLSSLLSREENLLSIIIHFKVYTYNFYWEDNKYDLTRDDHVHIESQFNDIIRNKFHGETGFFAGLFKGSPTEQSNFKELVSQQFQEQDFLTLQNHIEVLLKSLDQKTNRAIAVQKYILRISELIQVRRDLEKTEKELSQVQIKLKINEP